MSSFLYLLSVCFLFVGLLWLGYALVRKRSRRIPLTLLLTGFLLLIWSVVLVNVDAPGMAWTINVGLLLITMYILRRRRHITETATAKATVRHTGGQTVPDTTFEYVAVEEQVAQLKREKRYDEAIDLLHTYVEATELEARDRRTPVHSWPYQQLAIVHRKIGDAQAEIEVLERFSRQSNSGSKQSRRLLKRLDNAADLDGSSNPGHIIPLLTGRGVIVDCETTGFSGRDELIEIGLIAFDFNRATGEIYKTVDQYNGLREPRCPIPPDATAKHGLTIEHVRGHRLDAVKCANLFDAADVIIAHNASFDRRFVGALFPTVQSKRWLCSMNGIGWSRYGHSPKALQSLLADFEIEPGSAHRA